MSKPIMKPIVFTTLLGMMLILATPSSAGRQQEVDGTPIPDPVYRSYESNWRKYAVHASEVDGGYAYFPKYDRRKESTRGVTVAQAMNDLRVEREVKQGNLIRKQYAYPDRADAEAYVKALPAMKVGAYGWVASAEIVKIINSKQMIVKEIWLVDRPKLRAAYAKDEAKMERETGEVNRELLKFNYGERIKMMEQQEDRDEGFENEFRLIGYDTRGLRVGDRWKGNNDEGFQVGVVRWEIPEPEEDEKSSRRRGRDDDPRLVLTEMENLMRRTLDGEGFKKLLAERELTVTAFVDLLRTVRDADRRNAEERIRHALLLPEMEIDD